jgi:predicted transcriptional regulator
MEYYHGFETPAKRRKTKKAVSMPVKMVDELAQKANELRAHIGREFSDNYSGTLRSRLVEVAEDNTYCIVEEVANELSIVRPAKGEFRQPITLTHTAFFGI